MVDLVVCGKYGKTVEIEPSEAIFQKMLFISLFIEKVTHNILLCLQFTIFWAFIAQKKVFRGNFSQGSPTEQGEWNGQNDPVRLV